MELIKVGERTYYIDNPTNIGVYRINDNDVYLIDSGNDKEAGRKILKIINENGWNVKGIINTHSNADHIGGNKVIQDRTGALIYGYNIEKCFTEYPILESSFLYGGYPFKDLRSKFLCAKESKVLDIDGNLPDGLSYFLVRGHYFDMIGIKTSDDVFFLGDSLFSEETINKYHIFFVYDVREYLNTLSMLEELDGKLFIASHVKATSDISEIIDCNRRKIYEIIDNIYSFCDGRSFDDILKCVFDLYHLDMNVTQYVLVGSTVRSYLSYLYDEGKICFDFADNVMLWRKIN